MTWKRYLHTEILSGYSAKKVLIVILLLLSILFYGCSYRYNETISDSSSLTNSIISGSFTKLESLKNEDDYEVFSDGGKSYTAKLRFLNVASDYDDTIIRQAVDFYYDLTALLDIPPPVEQGNNPIDLTGHLMHIARGEGGKNLKNEMDTEQLNDKYPKRNSFFGVTSELLDEAYLAQAIDAYICDDCIGIKIDASYYYIAEEKLYAIPAMARDSDRMPIIFSYHEKENGMIEVLFGVVSFAGAYSGSEIYGQLVGEDDNRIVGKFNEQKHRHSEYGEVTALEPSIADANLSKLIKTRLTFCRDNNKLKLHSID